MALITLFSGGGSPGVTSTTVGLALTWPRSVLVVEADPTGSSGILPGYLRGQQTPTRTVIDLALGLQQGHLSSTLWGLGLRLAPDRDDVRLIASVKTHRQAAAMLGAWEQLADEFRQLGRAGVDVLVDAGRLGLEYFPVNLVSTATVSLLVTRCSLPAIGTARGAAHYLARVVEQDSALGGLLLIGAGHPYPARDVSRYLSLPVRAELPRDDKAARVFSDGEPPDRRWYHPDRLSGALKSTADTLARLADQKAAL
ncbi:MAG: hypothetical protein LBH76_04665 [Propionibacteriaceae bacterium]|jgi:hypothetical protein|nr:hypothetical protein [Propionibacteriaceae bacterium]